MLISKQHKFIFIHIYKNAGSSISQALTPHVSPSWLYQVNRIGKKLGIQAPLPKINVSKSKPYQSFYNKDTESLVRKVFQTDIELFGYEFV